MLEQAFFSYLQFEKRFSTHTLTAYRADLVQFASFLSDYPSLTITEAPHTLIRSWMVSLIDKGISPRSVNRKITTLRSYYKFLQREKIISVNPMVKIKAPKMPKRLPHFVEEQQMQHLLEKPAEPGDGFPQVRDLIVIELLYATGMRLSELTGLTNSGINFYEPSVKVLGKRNKERIIPIPVHLADMLKSYQELKRKTGIGNISEQFIVTDKGYKAYPKLIYRIVKDHLSMVTTVDKKSPHVLRHTFATHLLNRGADLNAIKELLGHASLAATQVYTHNSIEKLKNIYKQAHPKA